MKLLFYELAKFFSKKKVVITIVLFLGLNLLLFYSQNRFYYEDQKEKRPYEAVIEKEIEGLSTEDAFVRLGEVAEDWANLASYLQFKANESEPVFAEMLQEWMKNNSHLLEKYAGSPYLEDPEGMLALSMAVQTYVIQFSYIQSYPAFIQSVKDEADRMLTMTIFNKEGTFAYRNIIQTPEAYAGLERLELRPGPSLGLVQSSSYRLTDIFLLASLFLLCLYLFLHEEDTGLIRLVRTAKRGREATIVAKLGAVGLMSLLLALLFHGTVFWLGSGMFSFGDLTRPVQSIQEFKNCTIPLTVGEYIGVFLLIKMGMTLLSAWIISLVFLLCKRIKSIFVVLAAFFGISAICYYLISPTSWLSLLKYVNIFSFMNPYELLRSYMNLNCFSLAWNRLTVTLIAAGGLIVILPVVQILGYLKNYSLNFVDRILGWIGRQWAYLRRKQPLRGHVGLFGHEMRKILITGRAWIFLILALYLCLSTVKPDSLVLYDGTEILYRQYVTKWMGPMTPETKAAIEAERRRIDSIPEQMERLKEQYEANEIDRMDYLFQYSRMKEEHESLSKGFDKLYEQYKASLAMEAETGYTAAIVDELSSDYLFDNASRDREKGFLFLLLILLSLSAVFSVDGERGIEPILRCTVKGRGRRFSAQLLGCALCVIFLWACVYVPVITELLGKYTLSLDVPVQNIAAYRGLSLPLSIGQFALLKAAGSLLAGFCAAVCVLVVSHFAAKQGFCIMVSGVLLLFPFIALFLGTPILSGVSLIHALVPFQISGSDQMRWLIYMGVMNAVTAGGILFLYKKR